MKKKAQMQGGETIAVVIVIVIIIMIGVSFGTNRKIDSIEREGKQLDYQNAIRIALKAADLQELKCSTANSIGNTCLDLFKIKSMMDVTEKNTEAYIYYQSLFQNSEIRVEVLFPESTKENYVLYNYNDSINKSRTATQIPILVLDPTTDVKSFAILEVATYS